MTWIKCLAPNPSLPVRYYLVNLDNVVMAWPDPSGGDFWFLTTTVDNTEHIVDRQDNVILDGLA